MEQVFSTNLPEIELISLAYFSSSINWKFWNNNSRSKKGWIIWPIYQRYLVNHYQMESNKWLWRDRFKKFLECLSAFLSLFIQKQGSLLLSLVCGLFHKSMTPLFYIMDRDVDKFVNQIHSKCKKGMNIVRSVDEIAFYRYIVFLDLSQLIMVKRLSFCVLYLKSSSKCKTSLSF